MESKHTKGNWRSVKCEGTDAYNIYAGSIDVATIHNTFGTSSEEKEANAKLIESAPDLLEALNNLLAVGKFDKTVYTYVNNAKRAIKKATL